MRPDWHSYMMMAAKLAATRSTCNSRPTGAVLVRDRKIIASGYNGALHGEPHCSDQGPQFCARREAGFSDGVKDRACRASHAEANAIAQAARFGTSTDGASCYSTLAPCTRCMMLLSQAGVHDIFYEFTYDDELWVPSSINIFQQVTVPEHIAAHMVEIMTGFTSRRRMEKTL